MPGDFFLQSQNLTPHFFPTDLANIPQNWYTYIVSNGENVSIFRKVLNFKLLFGIVLIVAILEGIIIYYASNPINTFLLPSYYFSDLRESGLDGLVTAEGSFLSTTDLAFPVQTSHIECWQEFNHCWFADATLSENNFLSTGINLQEIKYWTDDFIETKPTSSAAGCVEDSYRLDRRSKTVTYTRRTLNNKTGICEGIQEEPITASMGDGLERLEIYKKIHNQ